MDKKETFNYTYSAKEQEEIKRIRSKYQPQEVQEDKMQRLRRLDASVTEKATVVSLVLGTIGALIMGSGMSLVMTDIGDILGIEKSLGSFVGILVGVPGIVLLSLAYPLYNRTLRKEREKVASEILRLSEELMK